MAIRYPPMVALGIIAVAVTFLSWLLCHIVNKRMATQMLILQERRAARSADGSSSGSGAKSSVKAEEGAPAAGEAAEGEAAKDV